MDDYVESEKVRIFHHELHRKHLKKSSILKLTTDDLKLEGHNECSDFLEKSVSEILSGSPELDESTGCTLAGSRGSFHC